MMRRSDSDEKLPVLWHLPRSYNQAVLQIILARSNAEGTVSDGGLFSRISTLALDRPGAQTTLVSERLHKLEEAEPSHGTLLSQTCGNPTNGKDRSQ